MSMLVVIVAVACATERVVEVEVIKEVPVEKVVTQEVVKTVEVPRCRAKPSSRK